MRSALCLAALGLASSVRLSALPSMRVGRTAQHAARSPPARCGFEVDSVDQKAIEELDVFNWPGLEKRLQDFEDRAVPGKLKMVYVKQGSAILEDEEDKATVSPGQMVLIDDRSDVRWSGISEGGLVLLSCETVLDDEDAAQPPVAPSSSSDSKDLIGKPLGDAMQEEMGEMSVGGLLTQLALGLLSGTLLAVGLNLFLTPDS